jgi:hypothetical protein
MREREGRSERRERWGKEYSSTKDTYADIAHVGLLVIVVGGSIAHTRQVQIIHKHGYLLRARVNESEREERGVRAVESEWVMAKDFAHKQYI